MDQTTRQSRLGRGRLYVEKYPHYQKNPAVLSPRVTMIALNLTVTRTQSLDKERSVQMQTVSVRWNVSLNAPMAAPARTVDVSVRLDSPVQRAMTMWMSVLCYQQTTASLTVRTLLAVTIVSVGRVSHWVPIKEPASKSMRSVSLGV